MSVEENRKYSAEIKDENNKCKIWLDLSMCNIAKEKSEKIINEAECAKERIAKILAE